MSNSPWPHPHRAKERVPTMFYLKACHKCQGDMYLGRDLYGIYQQCLQCGHIVELQLSHAQSNKLKVTDSFYSRRSRARTSDRLIS